MNTARSSSASSESNIDWDEVWRRTAELLGQHRAAGRAHLLTEDTLRMCSVLALESVGVGPELVGIEVLDPVLNGGKLDLVVGGQGGSVLELKYPRGSRVGASPDTMTLGELIRDFLRVALVSARERWVVQALGPPLRRYLGKSSKFGFDWPDHVGQEVLFTRDLFAGLPPTALAAIGSTPWRLPVRATCTFAHPVDIDLALFAFRVDAAPSEMPADPLTSSQRPLPEPDLRERSGRPSRLTASPRGARGEILATIQALTTRSGSQVVGLQQIVDEMLRSGTNYAESTIRTMVTSHMCASRPGPGIDTWVDLERVDRGLYRLRRPSDG